MKTLVIAEIGNNHNGSLKRALELIGQLKKCGAKIVKFQMRNDSSLYRKSQSEEDLGVEYIKDLLSKYQLSVREHQLIKEYCQDIDIEYMCTPWDLKSIESLEKIGVKRYKVASADFDNLELIGKLSQTKKQLILSTGMSTLEEIRTVNSYLKKKQATYALLHCNSTYPAPFSDIQLNFIKTLKTIHENIGYSGHERGTSIVIAAVAMGASIIEKHVTLDRELEGPDHQASIYPSEFQTMISQIKEVESALGKEDMIDKNLSQGVLLNKENLGKSIVAGLNIKSKTSIKREHLQIKSPGSGISPLNISKILNKKILVDKKKGDFIYHQDFTESIKEKINFKRITNWGIPVRPHDVKELHQLFDAGLYEFHLSYSDLEKEILDEDITAIKDKRIVVHAPELFKNSELLDLCSSNMEVLDRSIKNLQSVCNYCEKIAEKINYKHNIDIIANVGGFSTHNFKPITQRKQLYIDVFNSINKLKQSNTRIIPQNMAPYPWHFGGQRYQNIFMDSNEIIEYCSDHSRICLDTAHLSMYCTYANKNFNNEFLKLLPFAAHIHISDAKGLNGEGVILGTGDINFSKVMKNLNDDVSFIVETWQGHKNKGYGFHRDLKYLSNFE
tara:strand:- start:11926 stop:13770 length:1845 start_codon:yes stop_codon:yes gene_type:complete